MSNKKLIQQYVNTGIDIGEYQFNKLPNNIKISYMRSRIMAYQHYERPLERYEMDTIHKLPDEMIKTYVAKVPMSALGSRTYLRRDGVDVPLPDTSFEWEISSDDIPEYVNTNYDGDFFERILSHDMSDYNYYNHEAYKYVNFSPENEERIRKIIDRAAGGTIDTDNIEEALTEFAESEYNDYNELISYINSAVEGATWDSVYNDVIRDIKEAFSEYGTVQVDDDGLIIKGKLIDIIDPTEYYFDELDDYCYEYTGEGDNFSWGEVATEMVGQAHIDKPDLRLDTEAYADDHDVNEILNDSLSELL